jgi:hypothetical protein
MKVVLSSVCLLTSILLFSQNVEDKVLDDLCLEIKKAKHLSNEEKLIQLDKQLILYLSNFNENEVEEKFDYIFIRLQKVCEEFSLLIQEIMPPNVRDNWVKLSERPNIEISDEELDEFKKHSLYYYYEYDGSITNVTIMDNLWIDNFIDSTSSKLKFRWVDNTKFEIEFIESDNNTRKNLSKPGEKYYYQIINRENNYYWLLLEIPESNELWKFKFYINIDF